jgi:vacuolar-type H+-ATPase subunit E/Vma4
MKTIIKIILGVVLIGVAGYFLFSKNNSFSYKIPNLELSENDIASMASTTVDNIKTKASSAFSGITDQLQNKANEIISSSIDSVKNYAFDIFKQSVEDGVDKLREKAGITGVSIDSVGTSVDNSIVYSAKKGIDVYFTIINSEADILKYKVDWLDGNSGSGELTKKDQSIVLTHKWSSAGEYLINFNITNSVGTKVYKVKISVLN